MKKKKLCYVLYNVGKNIVLYYFILLFHCFVVCNNVAGQDLTVRFFFFFFLLRFSSAYLLSLKLRFERFILSYALRGDISYLRASKSCVFVWLCRQRVDPSGFPKHVCLLSHCLQL